MHGWSVAVEVGVEGLFPNRPYGNDVWGAEGMTRRGDSFICLIRFGGSCLELIRFGNRIGEGLIDFVPEID